jgi:hypothetical protein
LHASCLIPVGSEPPAWHPAAQSFAAIADQVTGRPTYLDPSTGRGKQLAVLLAKRKPGPSAVIERLEQVALAARDLPALPAARSIWSLIQRDGPARLTMLLRADGSMLSDLDAEIAEHRAGRQPLESARAERRRGGESDIDRVFADALDRESVARRAAGG